MSVLCGDSHLNMAVLLETSLGEICVDLRVEETPLAAKNFLKLCKLKYYHNHLFYNVQQNFLAQAGDPTATGKGGTSVYGLCGGAARRYFEATVGMTIDELWERETRQRARDHAADERPIRRGERGKWAFAALGRGTQKLGERYLREKVEDQGFCGDRLLSGLAALPKSVPQGHHWHLLKAHLRGHHTSERVHKALRTEKIEPCHFCGCGADSMGHLLECATVRTALTAVAGWTL